MPEVINIKDFEAVDGYDEDKNIKESIENARVFLESKLEEANSISNEIFKRIALLTIIDSLAMEENNYPSRNSKKAFTEFVNKYQDKYDFLEKIEPLTLYYDYEDDLNNVVIDEEVLQHYKDQNNENYSWLKKIDLNEYKNIDRCTVPEFMESDLTERLQAWIKNSKDIKDKIDSHKFINLIYKMRSKAVHEFGCLGLENPVERRDNKRIPYYSEVIKTYIEEKNNEKKEITYRIYELVIPNNFLYDLAENCINNYLEDCLKNKRFPYKNNDGVKRKEYLSWND